MELLSRSMRFKITAYFSREYFPSTAMLLLNLKQDSESLYFILTYAERGDFYTFIRKAFVKGKVKKSLAKYPDFTDSESSSRKYGYDLKIRHICTQRLFYDCDRDRERCRQTERTTDKSDKETGTQSDGWKQREE